MMPDIMAKLVTVWLDSAIPPALKDIDRFESIIERARRFCSILEQHGYTGWDDIRGWVDNAPAMWLAKCREIALDSVRSQLSNGMGAPKSVEKIERQMVSMAEAHDLATTSSAVAAAADNDDWDAGWADEGQENGKANSVGGGSKGAGKLEDDGGDAWGWDEEGGDGKTPVEAEEKDPEKSAILEKMDGGEDDSGDAWGWGGGEGNDQVEEPEENTPEAEEDLKPEEAAEGEEGDAWGWGDEETTTDNHPPQASRPSRSIAAKKVETREMVLKETYRISSMPEPVLGLIFAILEDGAVLTQTECVFLHSP